MLGNIDNARVPNGDHPTLFPLGQFSDAPQTPRGLCDTIGLNWLAAEALHERGTLSFDPNTTETLTVSQYAELRFLGALVVAGCTAPLLKQLLSGLEAPYCYRLDKMYYDWDAQQWAPLRNDSDVRLDFECWLDQLVEADELEQLERLRASIEGALFKLRQYYTRIAPW
jgi:hypothetical protein